MNTQLRGVPSYARREHVEGPTDDLSAGLRSGMRPSLRIVPSDDSTPSKSLDSLPFATDPNGRVVLYVPGDLLRSLDRVTSLEVLRRIRSRIGMKGAALIGIDLLQRVEKVGGSPSGKVGFTSSLLTHLGKKFDSAFAKGSLAAGARLDELGARPAAFLRMAATDSTARIARSDGMSHQHSLVALGVLARHAHLEVADCWTDSDERYEIAFLAPVRCPKAPAPSVTP